MMKASIGPTVALAAVKPSTSLALAAPASTAGCLAPFDRFALSKSVITLLRFTPTVSATATAKALSFARLVSTSGWWLNESR